MQVPTTPFRRKGCAYADSYMLDKTVFDHRRVFGSLLHKKH